ncbi:hypothetical protein IPM19_03195 [bacterium]|nr:MAG: hypothetical protein IPM19_03195 [bacterium]
MKKIIVIIVALFSLSTVALSQGDRWNVQIVVSGFEDNAAALAAISKDVQSDKEIMKTWRLVRSHPELILKVTAKTKRIEIWNEIDQSVANRNAMLKTIERESQRAVRRIRHRSGNGWVRLGAQIGRDIAVSRYVAPRYAQQKFRMAELVSLVEMELIDVETRKVTAFYSGSKSVVLKEHKMYGQEPMIEVIGGLPAELDPQETRPKQLLALAAYAEAKKLENRIGTESDRAVSRQRRAL